MKVFVLSNCSKNSNEAFMFPRGGIIYKFRVKHFKFLCSIQAITRIVSALLNFLNF